MIGVIDDEVHARKANDLMQLATTLIDVAPFWHKGSDF